MRQEHTPATVASKSNFIKEVSYFSIFIKIGYFVLKLFPFMGYYFSTAEASHWNYHLSTIIRVLQQLHNQAPMAQILPLSIIPCEHEGVITKLIEKSKQLIVSIGRQHDKKKRDEIAAEIQKIEKQLRIREGPIRGKMIINSEQKLRKDVQISDVCYQKWCNRISEQIKIKQLLMKDKQRIVKEIKLCHETEQMQYKLNKIKNQIASCEQSRKLFKPQQIVRHLDSLNMVNKHLVHQKEYTIRQKQSVEEQIIQVGKDTKIQKQKCIQLQKQKNQLQAQLKDLHSQKSQKITYQTENATKLVPPFDKFQKPQKTAQKVHYKMRKVTHKSEIVIPTEKSNCAYFIWVIILIIWAYLLFSNTSNQVIKIYEDQIQADVDIVSVCF